MTLRSRRCLSPAADAAARGLHCACCGGLAVGRLFCVNCEEHVAADEGQPYWERTWYFQHETICPVEMERRVSA